MEWVYKPVNDADCMNIIVTTRSKGGSFWVRFMDPRNVDRAIHILKFIQPRWKVERASQDAVVPMPGEQVQDNIRLGDPIDSVIMDATRASESIKSGMTCDRSIVRPGPMHLLWLVPSPGI